MQTPQEFIKKSIDLVNDLIREAEHLTKIRVTIEYDSFIANRDYSGLPCPPTMHVTVRHYTSDPAWDGNPDLWHEYPLTPPQDTNESSLYDEKWLREREKAAAQYLKGNLTRALLDLTRAVNLEAGWYDRGTPDQLDLLAKRHGRKGEESSRSRLGIWRPKKPKHRPQGSTKPDAKVAQDRAAFESQIEDAIRRCQANDPVPTKTAVAKALNFGGVNKKTGKSTALQTFNRKLERLDVDYNSILERVLG